MTFYPTLFLSSLVIATSACSSLPSWTGKYKRDDGKFDLYSEADEDLLEVTIIKAGGSLKDQTSIVMSFLAKIKDNRATEMQLCRNGLCAKECLSAVVRSKAGMIFESCRGSDLDARFSTSSFDPRVQSAEVLEQKHEEDWKSNIERALRLSGSVPQAAKKIGIPATTLYSMMNRYKIKAGFDKTID